MAAFCKEKNLKPSTFVYWVKMFSKNKVAPKMIKLEVTPTPQKLDNINIIVGNVKIDITGVLQAEKRSKLISVLMEAC